MSPSFRIALIVFAVIAASILTSCELGQTVMVSKGEAGGFAEVFSGQSEYCKFTSTPGVTISQAAQESFVKYCADVE